MNIPGWMENTLAGVLLALLIMFIRNVMNNYADKQRADKGVDQRVLDQLDERNKYVHKLEGRNDELYERNKKLTDDMTALMTTTITAAANQTAILQQVQEGVRKEMKDSITRVHDRMTEVAGQLESCRADHKDCAAQVEGLRRLVLGNVVAIDPVVTVTGVPHG